MPNSTLAIVEFFWAKILQLFNSSVQEKFQKQAFGQLLLVVENAGQAFIQYNFSAALNQPRQAVELTHSCIWTFLTILQFQNLEKKRVSIYLTSAHPKSRAVRRWVLSRKAWS